MTPIFNSICDLSERIPTMIADFLDLENMIGRRFREESITDIIIASILRIGGSNATVLVPPETITGGDFDIIIAEPSTGDAIQYRIQAKRLVPHAKHWNWSSYRELDHPHGSGGQSSTLIRSSSKEAISTIPLYAFYNPNAVCVASGGIISGIELADGYEINEIVKALVKAKAASRRPRWKRIEHLSDLFFPLTTILCTPSGGTSSPTAILPPRLSREAAETAIATRSRPEWMPTHASPRLAGHRSDLLPKPQTIDRVAATERARLKQFPAVIERALERRPDEPPILIARVKRPRIVLSSRSD